MEVLGSFLEANTSSGQSILLMQMKDCFPRALVLLRRISEYVEVKSMYVEVPTGLLNLTFVYRLSSETQICSL